MADFIEIETKARGGGRARKKKTGASRIREKMWVQAYRGTQGHQNQKKAEESGRRKKKAWRQRNGEAKQTYERRKRKS